MSADAARALLRAIRDDPDDDLPRLAFADWLDEHDEPDRAAFVRSGAIPPPRAEMRLDLQSGFAAARALRRVLQEMGAAPRHALRHLAQSVRHVERQVASRVLRLVEDIRGPLPNAAMRERPGRSRSGPDYGR